MSGDDSIELRPSSVAYIREVYDSENAYEKFEQELEKALEIGCHMIVIEPNRLGDETGRWISVGNCLHKTAVLSGAGAVVVGSIWREEPLAVAPLAAVSWFCTALYTVSWQFDPCCHYQVEHDAAVLSDIAVRGKINSASPVVLIKKDIRRRVLLHTTITTVAAVFCAWRLYVGFK